MVIISDKCKDCIFFNGTKCTLLSKRFKGKEEFHAEFCELKLSKKEAEDCAMAKALKLIQFDKDGNMVVGYYKIMNGSKNE